MDAFSFTPPDWVEDSVHAQGFCCPRCQSPCTVAHKAWINRRAPVYTEERRRKWQEFYRCECGCAWWAWSSDRPPSTLHPSDPQP